MWLIWSVVTINTTLQLLDIYIRGVHGSSRVGFVPNPDSTRSGRVGENQTRNRPPITTGRVGSDSEKRSVGSVETDEQRQWAEENETCRIWLEENKTSPIWA